MNVFCRSRYSATLSDITSIVAFPLTAHEQRKRLYAYGEKEEYEEDEEEEEERVGHQHGRDRVSRQSLQHIRVASEKTFIPMRAPAFASGVY